MRIIFMGTPEFAVPTLDALVAAGHDVVAAYSQPPRPGGRRGRELVPSPVQLRAQWHGIEVRTPVSFREDGAVAAFAALEADVAVVAAYGLILPQAVLDAPRLGCLNVHGSLLPRWRGAAPIQRAIIAGDAETGVCIMQMERGLDTGPVRLCKATHIGIDSVDQITRRLADLGAELMCRVLACPDAYPPIAQSNEGVTYAAKIDKAEAHLDFTLDSSQVARKVQALSPWPGAYFLLDGERIKLQRAMPLAGIHPDGVVPGTLMDLRDAPVAWGKPDRRNEAFVIACGDGYVLPSSLQRPGKTWMSAKDFLNGAPKAIGSIAA